MVVGGIYCCCCSEGGGLKAKPGDGRDCCASECVVSGEREEGTV